MKKILSITLSCLLTSITLLAQQPSEADMQKMMQNMMPGKMQAMMAESVGEWKADTKMWMDPSQPPMSSQAMVTTEMIMDGRYLCSKWKGDMMGMPFQGLSTTAYDNGTGNFYSTWIDNMSTGMTMLTGTMDKENKSIELKGVSQDPMTGKEMKMREVLTFVDKNTQTMVMYTEHDGKEMKMMEFTLTRVQ
ncbi:MAG: DUF1579 domain-containing protein [Chitinophagales bacterium]